jgi:hypothetical protein
VDRADGCIEKYGAIDSAREFDISSSIQLHGVLPGHIAGAGILD